MKVHVLSFVEDTSPLADVLEVILYIPQLALIKIDSETDNTTFCDVASECVEVEQAVAERAPGPELRYEETGEVPEDIVNRLIAAGRAYNQATATFEAAVAHLNRVIDKGLRPSENT